MDDAAHIIEMLEDDLLLMEQAVFPKGYDRHSQRSRNTKVILSRPLYVHEVLTIVASMRALSNARTALVKCGFVGKSKRGTGDPEINEIDAALGNT